MTQLNNLTLCLFTNLYCPVYPALSNKGSVLNILGLGEVSVYSWPMTASLLITLPWCSLMLKMNREDLSGIKGKSELWLIPLPRRNQRGMNFDFAPRETLFHIMCTKMLWATQNPCHAMQHRVAWKRTTPALQAILGSPNNTHCTDAVTVFIYLVNKEFTQANLWAIVDTVTNSSKLVFLTLVYERVCSECCNKLASNLTPTSAMVR